MPTFTKNPPSVFATKIGTGKPVVGATLVVARSRRQPIFISLMWPDKAMVIPAKQDLCKTLSPLSATSALSAVNPLIPTPALGEGWGEGKRPPC